MAHLKYINKILKNQMWNKAWQEPKWEEKKKREKQPSLEIATKFMYWKAKRNTNPSRHKKHQNLDISN